MNCLALIEYVGIVIVVTPVVAVVLVNMYIASRWPSLKFQLSMMVTGLLLLGATIAWTVFSMLGRDFGQLRRGLLSNETLSFLDHVFGTAVYFGFLFMVLGLAGIVTCSARQRRKRQ